MPSRALSERLAAVPLFASLGSHELDRLTTKTEVVSAAAGDVLLRQGEHGDRMYVVGRGSVQVYTGGFDGSDRALGDCRLLAISQEALLEALGADSDLLGRLRSAGEEQQVLRQARAGEDLRARTLDADRPAHLGKHRERLLPWLEARRAHPELLRTTRRMANRRLLAPALE